MTQPQTTEMIALSAKFATGEKNKKAKYLSAFADLTEKKLFTTRDVLKQKYETNRKARTKRHFKKMEDLKPKPKPLPPPPPPIEMPITLSKKQLDFKEKAEKTKAKLASMSPCTICSKSSFLPVCVKCLKSQNDKKEEIKNKDLSYNQSMEFKDILKIRLKTNEKIPMNTWTSKSNQSKNYKPSGTNNIGLVCNADSGIIGIDLDFYTKTLKDGTIKKYDPENIKEHKAFIDSFGKDYINKFDTLTQKTTNGGLHLIFKHDGDLKQTQNEHYNIDIRGGNTNGYLVGSGSVVNGKQYEIVNDTTIKPIPAILKEFLLNNLYDEVSEIINKKSIRTLKKVKKKKKKSSLTI